MTHTAVIEWSCTRCGERGRFANLPDTTLNHVRIAVTLGHERRSADCHGRRGITKIRAVFNGRTISFEKVEALTGDPSK